MPPTRRLFQSHLSRRPASAVPSSSSSSNSSINVRNNTDNNIIPPTDPNDNNPLSAEAIHMGISNFTTPSLLHPQSSSTSAASIIDDGEIIARDKNGGFQLDIPVLPPIPLDEEDEEEGEDEDEGAMEGIEEGVGRHSAGSGGSNAANGSVMGSELVGRDKEKLEAGLVEMMYRNRNRHLSGEPEILSLIQQSLRSKVAALDEDNWMFEKEDDPHV